MDYHNNGSAELDFHCLDGKRAMIPVTDSYTPLDLARRITSTAISSRISNIESELVWLRENLLNKERLIFELEAKVSTLERINQENQHLLKVVLDENIKFSKERRKSVTSSKKTNSDLQKVPFVEGTEVLPERPGEPSCPYYLKTQRCKYGQRCKFSHPQKTSPFVGSASDSASNLPERPSEPSCAFYMKTGKCKFGETCKFNHPKDIQSSLNGTENYDRSVNANGTSNADVESPVVDGSIFVPPALMHNSKGLPVRQGEVDCTFYMKTGSCKFGSMCRFNHPDRVAISSPSAAINNSFLASANLNHGVINALGINPALTQKYLGFPAPILPQRPGEIECDYYMKTGQCKYGDRCRFHHPMDRTNTTTAVVNEVLHPNPSVTLTPAGLPRRQEATMCAFYLRTGTCRFGATCKFDHPPPAEVMEKAASEGHHHPPDATLL